METRIKRSKTEWNNALQQEKKYQKAKSPFVKYITHENE